MECSGTNSRNCGQFSLLWKRRSTPLFCTQFFGAFNDNVFRFARKKNSVFRAILAVSWFWIIGLAYLTPFSNFVNNFLMGDQASVTLVLTVFSIGT